MEVTVTLLRQHQLTSLPPACGKHSTKNRQGTRTKSKTQELKTILNAFMRNWLAHYVVPKKLKTDRGSQFFSNNDKRP